jgi:hypothetical protein
MANSIITSRRELYAYDDQRTCLRLWALLLIDSAVVFNLELPIPFAVYDQIEVAAGKENITGVVSGDIEIRTRNSNDPGADPYDWHVLTGPIPLASIYVDDIGAAGQYKVRRVSEAQQPNLTVGDYIGFNSDNITLTPGTSSTYLAIQLLATFSKEVTIVGTF